MEKIRKGYSGVLNILEKICGAFAVTGLAAMTAIMVYQTIMRYIFHSGLTWAEELCRIIFIWCVLFVAFIAIRRGRHLQMSLIYDKMKPMAQAIYKLAIQVVCFALYIVLLKLSIELCGSVRGASGALGIPYKYSYLCIPIGTVFMMLAAIEQFFELGHQIVVCKKGGNEA